MLQHFKQTITVCERINFNFLSQRKRHVRPCRRLSLSEFHFSGRLLHAKILQLNILI